MRIFHHMKGWYPQIKSAPWRHRRFFFFFLLCKCRVLKIGFLSEYSYYTMFYQFLLYRKVNQLYLYVYPFFLGLPYQLGHYRVLNRQYVLYSIFSLVIYFMHSISSIYMSIPIFQFLCPTFPLGILIFILYICGQGKFF